MRALAYRPLAEVRAENAPVLIHPDDRRYGVLCCGVQGSGKTSVLARLYLNDLRRQDTCQIVLDPKSELAERCLSITPADCPKEVWWLDLGQPAFGISPLELTPESRFEVEAAAVAESMVAALLAANPGQIFQSSRRYLYHATLGALAIAACHPRMRRALIEHIHALLLPRGVGEQLRRIAARCCQRQGLEQSAFFFAEELPGELSIAAAATAARLDPPRNKLEGLLGVPSVRGYLGHPRLISLRELIRRRAILIVSAAQGTIGEENAHICLHFLAQALHRCLQQQMLLAEHQRPRVSVIADEAHWLLTPQVIRQAATHRAAGLELACGIQYPAQLGAREETPGAAEEVRKGVLNLLQSRFLFRLSDSRDAEEQARVAMALHSTLAHQDPDSRAQRRVGPETLLGLQSHFCVCSWIADGARAQAFIARTYPLPEPDTRLRETHLAAMSARLGEAGEEGEHRAELAALRDSERLAAELGLQSEQPTAETPDPHPHDHPDAAEQPTPAAPDALLDPLVTAGRGSDPHLDSTVAGIFAQPARRDTDLAGAGSDRAPESLRELALADRVCGVGEWETNPPAKTSLEPCELAVLTLLDRAGVLLSPLVTRAALAALPARSARARLASLQRAGLIDRAPIQLLERTRADGALPSALRLSPAGLEALKERGMASPKRRLRVSEAAARGVQIPHNQHLLAWIIALARLLGPRTLTDNWRTAHSGLELAPPRGVENRPPAPGYGLDEIPTGHRPALRPDAALELRAHGITFDLLIELSLRVRPAHNQAKLAAYDQLICGWWREHPRWRRLGTRPALLLILPDERQLKAAARIADQTLVGTVGVIGTPKAQWRHPARQHTALALEQDIHHGSPRCFALPERPPSLRAQLGEHPPLLAERVILRPGDG
jgi:hypothetical protein